MVLTPAEVNQNHVVRSCILAEVIAKNPIEIAYKNLCAKLGWSAIGYLEFGYWYYRFYEGEHSLECNFYVGCNPNYRLLTTLPADIILEISQYLNSEERLALRQVSLGMKHICNTVQVDLRLNSLLVYENKLEFFYGENLVRCSTRNDACTLWNNGWKYTIRNGNFLKLGTKCVKFVLEHPKLTFQTLVINHCSFGETWNQFQPILERNLRELNHKLSVKTLITKGFDLQHLPNILQFIQPGLLSSWTLNDGINEKMNAEVWNEIKETDCWKKLEAFNGVHSKQGFLMPKPLSDYFHLRNFEMMVHSCSPEDLILIRDILLKKPHFQEFEMFIKSEFDSNALKIVFGTETTVLFDYQVPGTADVFNCRLFGHILRIYRKR